jgi:hypothetical protein
MPFSRNELQALEDIISGKLIRSGLEWLVSTHIPPVTNLDAMLATDQCGWGVDTKLPITTWGGTVDGIRGLLACGVDPHDPLIARAVNWLVNQQRDDGSFYAREITWPCVEATAWIILGLRQAKYPIESNVFVKAKQFLESCISPTGGLGTSDKDEERIYPSAIALMALHDVSSEKERQVAHFLKGAVDKTSGGWGNYPYLHQHFEPNLAMTIYALYALLSTEYLLPDDALCSHAREYILAQINRGDNWESFQEQWQSNYKGPTDPPNPCYHYVTPWAVLALLKTEIDPLDPLMVDLYTRIRDRQQPNGSWRYVKNDTREFTWCVANTLVCLREVRAHLVAPVVKAAFRTGPVIPEKRWWHRFQAALTRENLNSILIIILFALILHQQISGLIDMVLAFLKVTQPGIIAGTISDAIWALLALVSVFVVTRFKAMRTRN